VLSTNSSTVATPTTVDVSWIFITRMSTVMLNSITSICCGYVVRSGSVAERLACWTQKGPGSNRSRDAAVYNSLRQTVHTHCASVHQAAKLVVALLRVAGVTAGPAESNGSLPPGL